MLSHRCLPLRPRFALVLGAFVAALVAQAPPARADGFLVPTTPHRPVRGDWALTHHNVSVVVKGAHAQVTVDGAFQNLRSTLLEAEYVFPLPHGATISSVTLYENGRGLEGRLLRAEEARRAYEEILRRQKDPLLLEYLGRDLFRVRVFPIPAGQTRRVVLQYDQLLTSDMGVTELVYPLNTEKFSARPLRKASVTVDIEADGPLGPVYSPSHDVTVQRSAFVEVLNAGAQPRGAKHAIVTWTATDVRPDTDFLLYWSTTRSEVGANLLTWWPHGEDRGYFLFLASPSIPDGPTRAARPKEITLVVDTSGSMAGDKIEQARAAVRQVLGALGPQDHFNVVAYHTGVVALWDAPRALDEANRREAMAFADGLRAQGGTNIEGALQTALAGAGKVGATGAEAPVILFLTDGRPTIGRTDTDGILKGVTAANAAARARMFVFGVGVDVNTVLLDRLALENRGAPTFVRPGEDVEPKVANLYDKMRWPVLSDLSLAIPGARPSEMLPSTLPDLFRGGQILVAGRYAQGGRVEAILSGRDGAVGREFHYVVAAAKPGEGLSSDFPARVWATRRIAQLVDAIRLHGRGDPELVEEIVRLSTRFGILTEYTAFLADETTDLHRLAENVTRARRELDTLTKKEVGGSGWAQSANQADRRGATRAQAAGEQTLWYGDEDDRGVRTESLGGLRQAGNKTFYRKGARWIDAQAPARAVDEAIVRWSPRFFELLATTTSEENAQLAQTGTVVIELRGRVLLITDPS